MKPSGLRCLGPLSRSWSRTSSDDSNVERQAEKGIPVYYPVTGILQEGPDVGKTRTRWRPFAR